MGQKVLILHTPGGMGHIHAAGAIEQAIQIKYPTVEVKNVNIIEYAPKAYQKIFNEGYDYLIANHPKLWALLYHGFNNEVWQKLPTLLSQLAIESHLIPFIKDFEPDFIIATHPLPMRLISASKKKEIMAILSSTVVTDFGCHSFWVDPAVNYYFVATEEVKKCLVNYKVKADKVAVTGIPIEAKFSRELIKAELLEKIDLKPDKFTFLIIGWQIAFADLKNIIRILSQKNNNIQFIVVAGRDKKLQAALNQVDWSKNPNIKSFEFVNNMEELMTVADFIFTKAGGLTVSECLAKGLPMIISKVIPGQEEDNVKYLVKKNAAIRVSNLTKIVPAVNELINNPDRIVKMREACQKIGRPKAAEQIADLVYNTITRY